MQHKDTRVAGEEWETGVNQGRGYTDTCGKVDGDAKGARESQERIAVG